MRVEEKPTDDFLTINSQLRTLNFFHQTSAVKWISWLRTSNLAPAFPPALTQPTVACGSL